MLAAYHPAYGGAGLAQAGQARKRPVMAIILQILNGGVV
jgi:hypothetical protein